MMSDSKQTTDILVIGAGISGLTTALEAAETGYKVVLVEKNAYVGGRVAQLNQYFPKLCPPACGLEINIKRLKDNQNITLHTLAEIISIEGMDGSYNVKLKIKPRYIKESCSNIEEIIAKVHSERPDDFNLGMNKSKAIYIPFNNAYPNYYILDKDACTESELKYLADAFKDSIDLEQKETIVEYKTKSIVWATGWQPYDANNLENLGYSKYPEVITNLEMERLSAPNGPSEGKIKINGSEKAIKNVAFVQCAGSRDENHLEYCSSVCCLVSLKQAQYIRSQYPDAEIHIFYIDIRTPGTFEEFYTNADKDEKLFLHRGKIAKVFKNENTGDLIVEAEDTMTVKLKQMVMDLVILATGMQPTMKNYELLTMNYEFGLDKNGFVSKNRGIIGCGVATRPKDVAACVQEATGAAMRAIHKLINN